MVRDPWLDNAKIALVTLVVVGHTWTLLPETALNRHLYDALYAWHIPAFVVVTGYLSRSFAYTPARLTNLVRTVVVPYVVFECLLALFRVYVGGEQLENLFADPHWPMWYLAAVLCWRLLTPILRPLPGAVAVSVAVAVSLAAGLWAGDTFDAARVLGLLPFFVLGLQATPERLERLCSAAARPAALLVLGMIALATLWTDRLASTEWLYYRARYDELDVTDTRALVTRVVVLTVGMLGTWAFLVLVPRVSKWFTGLGAATLVVYLVHGFFVLGAEYAGVPGWAVAHPVLSLPVATVGAVALALLLAWPRVSRRLTHLVDPVGLARREVGQAAVLATADLPTMAASGRRGPQE